MKYFEVQEFGGPEVLKLIEDRNVPNPGEGEFLLEVKAAGINYADVLARTGEYPPVATTPYRPGFEVAGLVAKIGNGVKNFAVGDAVAGLQFKGGCYSTHVIMTEGLSFKIPNGFDFAVASALLVQGLTAYFLVEESRIAPGETVLINGAAGGMGSLAVQIAAKRGATVIGLSSSSKHAFVLKSGAIAAFSYDTHGWSEKVLKQTDGRGVNVFIDSQGDMSSEDGFLALGRGGRWFMHSWMKNNRGGFPGQKIRDLIFKNVSIRGYSVDYNIAQFPRAFKDVLAWVADGSLKISVTKFALEDAARAHAAISERTTIGKLVLVN
jgi:NADPH:quinone reductase